MSDKFTIGEYTIGDPQVEAGDVEQFVDDTVSALSNPKSDAAQLAKSKGVDVNAFSGFSGAAVEVQRTEGVDLASITLLIVTISQNDAVKKVAGDLWEKVILPLIEKRFGVDALKKASKDSGKSGKQ